MFQPYKVWARDLVLSIAEHSLARELLIWLSSHFFVDCCVACVDGERVLLELNQNISAMESVNFTTICTSAGLSTVLVSSLLLHQLLLLSFNCFTSVMCQVVATCCFLRLSTHVSPNWASEINCTLISRLLWGSVCLCVLLTFQFSGAKEWIDQCFIVPDFAEPLVVPAFGGATSSGATGLGAVGLDNQPPEEMVAIIISMGFQRNLAIQALKATVSSLN